MQFTIILEQYSMVIFPPALYGLGKALAQLHRHFEALEKAKEGLELLPSYHLPVSLTWPGTDEILAEALAQNVEVHTCVSYMNFLRGKYGIMYFDQILFEIMG